MLLVLIQSVPYKLSFFDFYISMILRFNIVNLLGHSVDIKHTAHKWSIVIFSKRLMVWVEIILMVSRWVGRRGGEKISGRSWWYVIGRTHWAILGEVMKTNSFSNERITRKTIKLTFTVPCGCTSVASEFLWILSRFWITWSLAPTHHGFHEWRRSWAASWFSTTSILILSAWKQHVCPIVVIHVEQARGICCILLSASSTSPALGVKSRATSSTPATFLCCCVACYPSLWKLFCKHKWHDDWLMLLVRGDQGMCVDTVTRIYVLTQRPGYVCVLTLYNNEIWHRVSPRPESHTNCCVSVAWCSVR